MGGFLLKWWSPPPPFEMLSSLVPFFNGHAWSAPHSGGAAFLSLLWMVLRSPSPLVEFVSFFFICSDTCNYNYNLTTSQKKEV